MKKIISGLLGVFVLALVGAGVLALRVNEEGPVALTDEQPNVGNETLVIAFGDSLTAGYGVPLGESYPVILERTLRARGYAIRVVNAGVSGETTAGARERASFIRAQGPSVVLLGIGGNDALRSLPMRNVEENLRAILSVLTSGGDTAPAVLLLRMQAPQNAGIEYKEEFDALYPKLAREYHATLVPFLTEEVFRDRRYLLDDGIHPTADGYALLVEKYLAPALISHLERRGMVAGPNGTE